MRIVLEKYSKIINNKKVLCDINLTFNSGTVYGIKGSNGSGKTMLLRAISGLIHPTNGTVTIDGQVLGRDISFPNSIGVLIESPSFLSNHTAFQNLKLISGIKRLINDEEIEEVLRKVGLDPFDKRSFKKYSLGMKQKLGIAAAIMERPDIIILDEPFNALDEDSVSNINSVIREERERGAIVFITCHDSKVLEELADTVVTIEDGNISGIG